MMQYNKIVILVALCLLQMSSFATPVAASQSAPTMPPQILKGPPNGEIVYRNGEDLTLECEASGYPQPRYEWLKNGVVLSTPISMEHGNIKLTSLGRTDAGYYQCRAVNMHGVALSDKVVLKMAHLGHYPPSEPAHRHGLVEGQPFSIRCNRVLSYPAPGITWSLARGPTDWSPVYVIPDKRIQIDNEGNLQFSYLMAADEQDGRFYKCNVYNSALDLTVSGSYTQLHITPVPQIEMFRPGLTYLSPRFVRGLANDEVRLRCIFAGYPDPAIIWSRSGNVPMPVGRYRLTNYNTELIISPLHESDEGEYICEAENARGMQQITLHVTVESKPHFESPSDKPQAVNVTEGDDVHMVCRATGEPDVNVVWFRNGIPLSRTSLSSKMRLTNGGTELFIYNVCKNCADGSSDIQVLQCNASNANGYVFANAYVNILDRTSNGQEHPSTITQYCHWDTFSPHCDNDFIIDIISASYGRPHASGCINDVDEDLTSDNQYLGCQADVLRIVQGRCHGRQQCNLSVQDPQLTATNTCFPGLYVFLEVEYRCIHRLTV